MPIRLPHATVALWLLLPVAAVCPVRAESVRLLGADDRGVTLELRLADYLVGPASEDGRSRLTASGLTAQSLPGRPVLPTATALVALPPGARPVLGLVDGDAEEARTSVRLWIGERPGFREDPQGLGVVPSAEPAEPIRDGPWPTWPVELGTPFTLRGQRMVA